MYVREMALAELLTLVVVLSSSLRDTDDDDSGLCSVDFLLSDPTVFSLHSFELCFLPTSSKPILTSQLYNYTSNCIILSHQSLIQVRI